MAAANTDAYCPVSNGVKIFFFLIATKGAAKAASSLE